MRRSIVLLSTLAGLAACNQSPEQPVANNLTAAATPKQPVFCFFKDGETKGWTAAADASGKITVKGKAHVKDGRYMAQLGKPEIDGTTAKVWLSIATNSTAYSSPDDTWDVSAQIPADAGVTSVSVMCGNKSVADLALKKG